MYKWVVTVVSQQLHGLCPRHTPTSSLPTGLSFTTVQSFLGPVS